MTEPIRVLCADPPWKFGDNLPGPKRGAASHYGVMTTEQIEAFELPPLAPDAVLLLWRVASMQREALDVVEAWGFVPKAEIVWIKTARRGSRIPLMGMGRSVRNCHETAIIATRGRPKKTSSSELSVVFSPRLAHSRKPEKVYRSIERLYPGPYCEIFARRQRPGWQCEGLELERKIDT